ncbi:MAG TPA: Ig-like domain-containing protein [candidate division Zixibacteria bacterium]|jgi:hypothetical protein
MRHRLGFRSTTLSLTAVLLMHTTTWADPQSFHRIGFNEIHTNADGTRQYVELIAKLSGQTNLSPVRITAFDATGTTETLVHDFTASFPALGLNETVLLATAAVAADMINPPDFIIPDNSIPITDGRLVFRLDPPGTDYVDAVAYGNYTGSNTGFGTPALALPSNGCQSLVRTRIVFPPQISDNSTDYAIGTPSPQPNGDPAETIDCPPQAPILEPIDDAVVNEGQTLLIAAVADDANGDPMELSAENLPLGASFNSPGDGTGSFMWTPGFTQSGVYNVLVIASDGALADSQGVEITVTEVTDPPEARDSTASGVEDVPLAANLQALDPDGDPLTYSIVAGPFHGEVQSLLPTMGNFTYAPDPDFFGDDSLYFAVTDGIAPPDTGVWRVLVAPVNDPPVADDAFMFTLVNTQFGTPPMPVTDVDDVSWTIAHTAGPLHGSIDNFDAGTGAFDYTPDTDYLGLDTILYQANDGEDLSNIAMILINIAASCACDCHGDPVCDSVVNVFDVVKGVDVAFRAGAPVPDPNPACPRQTTDVTCDNVTNVFDVVKLVDVAFRAADPATVYCDPCA